MKRLFIVGLLAICLGVMAVTASFAVPRMPAYENNLSEHLQVATDDEMVPMFIGIENPYPLEDLLADVQGMPLPQRREHAIITLQQHFTREAASTASWLRDEEQAGRAHNLHPLWIAHGFSVQLRADRIKQLAELDEVSRIRYQPPIPFESVSDEMPDPSIPEPNTDELDEISWAIPYIGADDLWSLGYTGESVIVALIDSGVDPHDDLIDHQWINEDEIDGNGIDDDLNGYVDDMHGWNFYHNTPDISDAQGHGTKCTGIVVGDGTLGTQTGIAPDARWMMIRNYASNWVSEGTRAAAVQYAVTNGASVISCSMTYKYNAPWYIPDYVTHRYTYLALLATGVISANSTGNDGGGGPIAPWNVACPGNCPPPFLHPEQYIEGGGITGVMGIGAHDSDGDVKYYSADGPAAWEEAEYPAMFQDYPWAEGALPGLMKPDFLAPTEIPTTDDFPVNGYTTFTGSSASTPVAGGAMVLLRDIHPQAPPEAIAEAIMMTAEDAGDPGFDNEYGAGRLRVDLAHAYLDDMYDYGSLQVVIDGAATQDSFTVTVGDGEVVRKTVGMDTLLVERVLPGMYDVTVELPGNDLRYYSDVSITSDEMTELTVGVEAPPMTVSPDLVEATIFQQSSYNFDFDVSNPSDQTITVTARAIPEGGADWVADDEYFADADSIMALAYDFFTDDLLLAAGRETGIPKFWLRPTYEPTEIYTYTQPERFGTRGVEAITCSGHYNYDALYQGWIYKMDYGLSEEFIVEDSLYVGDLIADPVGLTISEYEGFFIGDRETREIHRINTISGEIIDSYDLGGMIPVALGGRGFYWLGGDPERLYILGETPIGGRYLMTMDFNEYGELVHREVYPEFYTLLGYQPRSLALTNPYFGISRTVALADSANHVRFFNFELKNDIFTEPVVADIEPGGGQMQVTMSGTSFVPSTFQGQNIFDLLFESTPGGYQDTTTFNLDVEPSSVNNGTAASTLPITATFEKAYPNPFNSTVTLQYALPSPEQVRLAVYDILGREVAVLDNNRRTAGRHQVVWTTGTQATGIYFAVLEAGDVRMTKKLLLMK